MVIIFINFVDLKSPMLHAKFQDKDRIAQKLLCFTHDLDTKHQRQF